MKTLIALSCFFAFGTMMLNLEDTNNSMDFAGKVSWNDSGAKASEKAAASNKQILQLESKSGFKTADQFGDAILSHPLIVEIIEDHFVPVLKKPSDDVSRPTISVLTGNGTEVLAVQKAPTSIDAMVDFLMTAMAKANQSVPDYLNFARSIRSDSTETAEFAMHCYWEGEAKLGSIHGVHTTRSGWRGGLEVVQLEYSPNVVDYQKLLNAAQSFDCASKVFTHSQAQQGIAKQIVGNKAEHAVGPMRDAKASDQKYYLLHTIYKYLPLTERQATKINSLAKLRKTPGNILSPRQQKLLKSIQTAISADKKALINLQYPENQADLFDYQQKLTARLKQLGTL